VEFPSSPPKTRFPSKQTNNMLRYIRGYADLKTLSYRFVFDKLFGPLHIAHSATRKGDPCTYRNGIGAQWSRALRDLFQDTVIMLVWAWCSGALLFRFQIEVIICVCCFARRLSADCCGRDWIREGLWSLLHVAVIRQGWMRPCPGSLGFRVGWSHDTVSRREIFFWWGIVFYPT